jgi:hypothetical protein
VHPYPAKKLPRAGTIKFNKIENLQKVTNGTDYQVINIKKGNPNAELSLGESVTENNCILKDREPRVGVNDDQSSEGEKFGKTYEKEMWTIKEVQGDSTLRERRLDDAIGGSTTERDGIKCRGGGGEIGGWEGLG